MNVRILSRSGISKLSISTFGPLIAFVLVYGFFAILNVKILSLTAIETIVQQTVIVGIAAIGMTFVIISGGIDLSVGSIIAMGSVAVAYLMQTFSMDPLLAAIGGIAIGFAWGFINGFLIARFRMVPFIVTLGTLLVVRGVAKGVAQSMPINTGYTWLSDLLATLPQSQKWQLLPSGAWLMIVLAFMMAAVLKYLPIGRHVFAIGSSEQTARLCGIAVERVKIIVYTLCGGFASLGGLMLMSYQEQGDPTAALGLELDVIAAVVIGGGSLSGGEGSIQGSIIGAIIMTVIRTGCQLNGWPTWVTQVVTGAVIVVAVAIDRIRHNKS
jgi:ribose/xylose/arabinose/galactoside ABC-type transport system permease subunit